LNLDGMANELVCSNLPFCNTWRRNTR
jgi:hypothetical protein